MPSTPRARSWLVLFVAGAGVTVVGLAACGSGPDNDRAVKVDATAPVATECPGEEVPAGMERLVVQGDDDTPIGTATVGSGATTVVLVHGSGQDLCDWLWFVPRLVDLGVTVVPYDLRGRGSSSGAKGAVDPLPGDLAAVVDAARQDGAERVVLVGTSLGAATALVAAGRIEPPVDAVVAVSPPGRLGAVAVADAASSYDGPVYLVVAKDDDGYPATVRDLATALPGATTPIILDGSEHGLRLVQARPDDVAAVIERSVQDAGGP